jgi:hypothetical protein
MLVLIYVLIVSFWERFHVPILDGNLPPQIISNPVFLEGFTLLFLLIGYIFLVSVDVVLLLCLLHYSIRRIRGIGMFVVWYLMEQPRVQELQVTFFMMHK